MRFASPTHLGLLILAPRSRTYLTAMPQAFISSRFRLGVREQTSVWVGERTQRSKPR